MWAVVEHVLALARIPLVQLALVLTLVAGGLLAQPVARLLRWSWLGSAVAMWGLGAAISVTFVSRLGQADAVWDPALIRACFPGPTSALFESEGLLNLALLVPFGIGLYLASHNGLLSSTVVVVTALSIEALQAATGLGLCQLNDSLRNAIGGLVGVGAGWLLIRILGARVPSYLLVGGREQQTPDPVCDPV